MRECFCSKCGKKTLVKVHPLRYIPQCFDTRYRQTLFDLAEGWG
jgi:rRNA maturation protein Nop10